jgi:hypothetical protein
MPLPSPDGKQEKNSFLSGCMSDPTMNKEFPDSEQRAAVCYNKWRKAEGVTEIDFTEQIVESRKEKESLEKAKDKARKKYDKENPEKRRTQKRDYNRRERKKDPDIWK